MTLSGEGIGASTAIMLSLLLAYIPGLAAWWEKLEYKRQGLAILGLVLSAGMVALHYANVVDFGLAAAFSWRVVGDVLRAWFAFIGAGQVTYTTERMLSDRNA